MNHSMHLRVFTAAALFTLLAGTAGAQQGVKLQFNDGQVTLSAQNAPVRAILQEWARLGGATIVNGDRVTGPPVTLELTGVPERQALDIVLRSVAGYIVAPRPAGSQGASAFDRIMILPTSVAPRAPAPAAAGRLPQPRPGIMRPPEADPGIENQDPLEDPSALVQGRDPRVVQPPLTVRPPIVGDDTDTDQIVNEGQQQAEEAPAGTAPTPSNPFGVPFGSSATPGVISPAPQQPQPRNNPNRVQ
jgi:hypothetical protein